MTNAGKGRGQVTRLGWLATTLLLAGALVVGSWVSFRQARAAEDLLNQGQADVFESAARAAFHPWEDVDADTLMTFLSTHGEAGLRYIGLLSPDGALTLEAGEPGAPVTAPTREPSQVTRFELSRAGDRVRALAPRPAPESPGPDGRPRSLGGRDGSNADARTGGPGRPSTGFLLLEFEPVVASGLASRASSGLALSWAAAAILTLAALQFWRSSARAEEVLAQREEERRLTQLGEMSAVMAHEIRNPLASLKGHAQLLAERLPDQSRDRSHAERVVSEATRLEALTSDLLDFARTGSVDLRSEDPSALLRAAADEADPDGIEVDTSGAPDRWNLDAGRLRRALVNLLLNARQASPSGPVRARVSLEHGDLIYEIRDLGKGLPAGMEDRIFEPFVTTRTNGTGLGLAVVRRVVELHGGTVSAADQPDGGAVFRLTIPRGRG